MISVKEAVEALLVLVAGVLMMYGAIHLTGLLIRMGVGI
jgi:hypothetical protein